MKGDIHGNVPQYFRFILSSNSNNCCLLYFNTNIMCNFTKKASASAGTKSSRPPTGAPPCSSQPPWLRSPERVMFKVAMLMFIVIHGSAPTYVYLSRLVRVADLPEHRSLHSARSIHLLVPSIRLSTVSSRAFPVLARLSGTICRTLWLQLLLCLPSASDWKPICSLSPSLTLYCTDRPYVTGSGPLSWTTLKLRPQKKETNNKRCRRMQL